jgi:hypothetical protein
MRHLNSIFTVGENFIPEATSGNNLPAKNIGVILPSGKKVKITNFTLRKETVREGLIMLRAFISGFLGALLGGLVVAGWFYFFQPKPYVLDIKSIIDSEKEMILKQVEEKKLSQESAGQRINEFFDSVNEVLSEYRRSGKFILVKDAVLSGGRDITDEFREKLKTEYNKQ